jgi:hypothetical protein
MNPMTVSGAPARSSRLLRLWRSTAESPRYVGMRTLARFGWIRQAVTGVHWLTHRASTRQRDQLAAASLASTRVNLDPAQDVDAFVTRLRTDGVALGLRLRDEDVQAIHAYANTNPCFADRNVKHGFHNHQHRQACQAMGKQILVAQYFNTQAHCECIARLVHDPLLRLIAGRYLGSTPTFVGANLWWTYPVKASDEDRSQHAHLFHRDVDDFRFMKFFFYLTDVQPGDGAHVCVRGSHEHPPVAKALDRWLIRRYSDEEIGRLYPAQDVMEITGAAGVGFAENTLCVHKGLTPRQSPRLLLQLQFALFDYGNMHDLRTPEALELLDV